MIHNVTETTLEFKHNSRQTFGGFKMYWKLIKEYYIKSTIIDKSFWFKIKEFFNIEIYHRFIKPFKKFYSYKIEYAGFAKHKIIKSGDVVIGESIERIKDCTQFKTKFLFSIPFSWYLRDMSDDEIKERFKK